MLSSVIIYMFISSIRNIRSGIIMVCIAFGGFASIIIPSFLYLYNVNAISAFFNEYVINTLYTVSNNINPFEAYLHDLMTVLSKPELCILFGFSLWGCWSIAKSDKKNRYFFIIILFLFWFITIKHNLFYYFSICTFFPVFAIISILSNISHIYQKKYLLISILTCLYVLITNVYSSYYDPKYIRPDYRIVKSEYYKEQIKFDSIIIKYKNPTIVYFDCLDRGDGIICEALPATKYWFKQNGATKVMESQHLKAIKSLCADFVITESTNSDILINSIKNLKKYGYIHCINIKQYDRWGIRYRALLINPNIGKR